MTTPETIADLAWYLDIGATHHVAHPTENVEGNVTHLGIHSLFVVDGASVDVTKIGHAKLLCDNSHRPLNLNNVFVAPT